MAEELEDRVEEFIRRLRTATVITGITIREFGYPPGAEVTGRSHFFDLFDLRSNEHIGRISRPISAYIYFPQIFIRGKVGGDDIGGAGPGQTDVEGQASETKEP
jgi:hypothetical protein